MVRPRGPTSAWRCIYAALSTTHQESGLLGYLWLNCGIILHTILLWAAPHSKHCMVMNHALLLSLCCRMQRTRLRLIENWSVMHICSCLSTIWLQLKTGLNIRPTKRGLIVNSRKGSLYCLNCNLMPSHQ